MIEVAHDEPYTSPIEVAGKAAYTFWARQQNTYQLRWDELHEMSQELWRDLARVTIDTYAAWNVGNKERT